MTPLSLHLYRASLHAYPADFRRDYGPALEQSLMDQYRVAGSALWLIVAREIIDVASTAPRMRGESAMTRFALGVAVVTLSIGAASAMGPLAVIAVVSATAAMWFGFVSSTSTAERIARQGASPWWLVSGLGALAGAVIIPAVDGGELSEAWWAVMAGLALIGIGLLVTAAVIYASRKAHRASI